MNMPRIEGKADALVFLSILHVEDRNDLRLAPGAYVAKFSGIRDDVLWGTCAIKNSETIFAYAIDHIVHHHLTSGGADPFSIEIFVHKSGFKAYLERYVPEWIAKSGINSAGIQPDAYEKWKYTFCLFCQGNIRINHLPRKHADGAYRDLDESVRRLANHAHSQFKGKGVGLIQQGDGQFPWLGSNEV